MRQLQKENLPAENFTEFCLKEDYFKTDSCPRVLENLDFILYPILDSAKLSLIRISLLFPTDCFKGQHIFPGNITSVISKALSREDFTTLSHFFSAFYTSHQ